jgi:lysophospholipase L1-like esterase
MLAAVALLASAAACSKPLEGPGDLSGVPTTLPKVTRTYVALGDSYSAGGGAPPYRADGSFCLRSDRAWPVVLAAPARMDLLACGGATVSSLIEGIADKALAPQLPATPADKVELVTLTLGLNDVAFFQFVVACVQGECLADDGEHIPTDKALERVQAALVEELYPTLQERFPNARIVHVGYPQLVPAAAAGVVGCPWMSDQERQFLRAYQDSFDAMVQTAVATTAGEVEYLRGADALAGHELCTAASQFVAMDTPDGSGGHMSDKGYITFANHVRTALAQSR